MEYEGIDISRIAHDAFRITIGKKVIYIDPFRLQRAEPADLVLVTHEHFDHCSLEDLAKVCREENTVIVTIPDCLSKVAHLKARSVITLEPGKAIQLHDFRVEAVPAYNLNKFRSLGIPFHPKEDGKIGFILTVNGKRVYHAGDTDFIPEMKDIKNIDIALLPVSGTYVMTVEEAVEAAKTINAKITIPMHYGAIVGTDADAQRFKRLYEGRVEIV